MQDEPKRKQPKSRSFKDQTGETGLKEQVQSIQFLLDSYPGSLYSVDRNYRYTAYNRAHELLMLEVYGAQIKPNTSPLDYITYPEYHELAKQKLDQVLISGEAFVDLEYSIDKAGSKSFFNIHYTPIKDKNSVVIGISVFAEDVTELKQSNDIYKQTEELYGNIFREISSVILIIDVETNAILNANPAACAFYGYTQTQLTALKISDLAVLSEEEIQSSMQKIANGEANHFQHAHRLANGEIREVDVYAGTTTTSGRRVNIAIIHDISEQKIAEEKLQEILKNLQDASYRRNLKTDSYDYMSPAIEQMSGFTSEEMIAMSTETVLTLLHTDDLAAIEQTLITSTANPGKSYQVEYRFKNKLTGQYRWFQDRFTTTLDDQGHPAFRYGNVRDITNQKIMEDAKKEAEFRYHSLFEQLHDAIFILDLQGFHLAANQRAADLMGYTTEEMRGLSVNETSAELQKSKQVIQQLLNGEQIPLYERIFKKKDGTVFPVEINIELVRDSQGNPLHIQSVVRDISERKMAEERLRESEDRYRTFVENSFDAITFVDENGNISEWNHAAESLTGIKKEDVLGKPYWDVQIRLTTPEHKFPGLETRIKATMLEMIETGQSPFFDRINNAELVRPDGTRRSVEQIVFPAKMKNGSGIRSVAHDITERKMAEEKLRDSEERFRLLFENSQAVMLIIEPENGEILDANPAAVNFYGYTLNQLHSMSIGQINTLPSETIKAELQLAADEKRNYFVFPHRLANGELCTVEVHSSPIQMKGRQVLFSIIHDITKRKLAEEKLIESEERFSTAFHSSQETISISRLSDGVYIDVNDAFCSIFEISRGQVIGRTNKELNFWANAEQRTELFNTIREKGRVPNFEAEYRSKTGRAGFMQASMALINIAGEECVLIFGRDVTAQKKAEKELRTAHEELEQRVRERTAELQTAIASLEKAAQVKDEFLSIMGHELRTPLNVILGSAQLLEEEVYGPLNEKQTTAVTSIETSGEKLLVLLNNILDLSKLQNKDTSLNLTSCSLSEICRSVLESTATTSAKKQIQVNFSITPDEIVIQADKHRVEQIIFNLYSNAIKFTPTGGKIGMDVLGSHENKNVKIIVWDTGIGIQNENLPRLFRPFAQLDTRLARDYDGSGLGLALSKQLAELFGGSITVESVFGTGSRFTLTLPWMG